MIASTGTRVDEPLTFIVINAQVACPHDPACHVIGVDVPRTFVAPGVSSSLAEKAPVPLPTLHAPVTVTPNPWFLVKTPVTVLPAVAVTLTISVFAPSLTSRF